MQLIQNLFRISILAIACVIGQAAAQDLPAAGKQMRLIVPFAPGGATDILGRMLAQRLGDKLGRSVIVENRAGAGGSIGTLSVVRSDPDGSTILLNSGAVAMETLLKRKPTYDVQRDLLPVTTVAGGPFVLLVNADLPVQTVGELIAYARANPGKLNFGTPGVGSSVHITTESFKVAAGIDMVHVPFRGASPALNALMAGEVQVVIDVLGTARRTVESRKVRALAVTTADRTDLWSELPSMQESGVRNMDEAVWFGLFVPSNTPQAVVNRLNAELVSVLRSPDMVAWLRDQGLQPIGDPPAQARARLAAEVARWAQVIKAAGIEPE
jgi:tripartite-type tricarboxylate transporter receptor subunit TctC